MSLPIAQLGQPVLRVRAAEVELGRVRSPDFQAFLDAMLATMVEAPGVGLAAPQVFVPQRIFVATILPPATPDDPPSAEVFINPVLTPLSEDRVDGWEGCLSFSELVVKVPRFQKVRVDYVNRLGQPAQLILLDFPARVVQHENDHLDGILTLDRAASTLDIVKASELQAWLGNADEPDESE